MNITQSLDWLKSQGRKLSKSKKDSEGWVLNRTEKDLLELINVQTGLIEKLNEELLQLRRQQVEERETLQRFMAKEGFNYPP
jgi:hypothetical protein